MVGIYKITSPSGKVYIGQSWNIENRICKYKNLHCQGQPKLFASLSKYGWGAHKFEIIVPLTEDVSQRDIDGLECLWISVYTAAGFTLLNLTEGGSNGKMSEETRKKMSEVRKGMKFSSTHVEKMRQRCMGNKYHFWKTHTVEAKNKVSVANTGRRLTEDQKRHLSIVNTGRKATPQTIEKLRLRMLGSKLSPEHVASMSKPVLQISLDGTVLREWGSIAEATRTIKVNNISYAISGARQKAGGFKWKFKTQLNGKEVHTS